MAGTPRNFPDADSSARSAAMEPALEWREHRSHSAGRSASAGRPQWSPPWNGGNTRVQLDHRRVAVVAAMEPALEWREHPTRSRGRSDGNGRPQWSPPWNGGNTTTVLAGLRSANPPQWSPPWNGGNTCSATDQPLARAGGRNGARLGMAGTPHGVRACHSARSGAAMEPALEWREHHASERLAAGSGRRNGARLGMAGTPLPHRHDSGQHHVPQWSPPWNGGNTAAAYQGNPTGRAPQWSPPWNGGNTRARPRRRGRPASRNGARLGMAGTPARMSRVRLTCGAAMEPALEWREHLPRLRRSSRADVAAMEPALEWREHVNAGHAARREHAAAMEPALEWREHR